MSVVLTVKQLKAAIADLPDDLPVQGYDGSGRECCVSVYVNDFEDWAEEAPKPPTVLVVDVD